MNLNLNRLELNGNVCGEDVISMCRDGWGSGRGSGS